MLYQRERAEKPSAALIGYHIQALLCFWGSRYLADIRASTCRAYAVHRVAKGRKPQTARRELKTLSAAINHWHRESPLPAVPQVTLPAESAPRETVFTRQQVAGLIRHAIRTGNRHLARFVLIGVYTGTRHDAILSLQWRRAVEGGCVDVLQGLIYRRGTGERETSKRRPPHRPMPRLLAHLRRWQRMDTSTGALFVITYRGAGLGDVGKSFATAVEAIGLDPRQYTPHTLRHTCATWLLRGGLSVWDVAGWIGADATTVERVYGHHIPSELGANLGQIAIRR